MNPFHDSVNHAIRALSHDGKLRVIHRNLPKGHPASFSFEANAIILPKVNPEDLSEADKRTYRANVCHEQLHHRWSQKKAWDEAVSEGTLIKTLTNILEDARIELKPQERLIGGARELAEDNRMIAIEITQESEKRIAQNRFGYVMNAIFTHKVGCGELPLTEEIIPYFDIACKILADGRFDKSIEMDREGNAVTLTLAEEIAKAWQENRDKDFEDKEPDNGDDTKQHQKSDGGSGSGSGDGDDGQPDSDKHGESDDGGSSPLPENGEVPEEVPDKIEGTGSGGDADEAKTSGEDAGDPQGEDDGEDDRDQRGARMPEAHARLPEDDDAPTEGMGSDGGIPDEEEDGDGGQSSPAKNEGDDSGDDAGNIRGKTESTGPHPQSIEEELKKAQGNNEGSERGRKVAKMGKEGDPADFKGDWWNNLKLPKDDNRFFQRFDGDPHIPYEVEDREIVATEVPEHFKVIEQNISTHVSALQSELARLLRSRSMTRRERNHKHGRLDPRQFHKIINGSTRVKTKIIPGQKITAAVTLLIDLSGSMSGVKANLAVEIATLFGEALIALPEVSFEILGYNSSDLSPQGEVEAKKTGHTRLEVVNYWIFKQFHENWRNVRFRMGACGGRMNGRGFPDPSKAVGGCNCDHNNLEHAAHRLYQRKEEKKILIVLCDGQPSGCNGTYSGHLEKELHRTVAKIRASRMNLFCLGIQAHAVEEFYAPDVEIIQSLGDVPEAALMKLGKLLLA